MTYQEREKNKIPAASKKDCNKIGELLFKVTNDPSRGSTKIKDFLRSGIKFHQARRCYYLENLLMVLLVSK